VRFLSPPDAPGRAWFDERYSELARAMEATPESAPADRWQDLALRWGELRAVAGAEYSRLHGEHSRDLRVVAARDAVPLFHREVLAPAARADAVVRRRLLQGSARRALEARWPELIAILARSERLHDERNVELAIEVAAVEAEAQQARSWSREAREIERAPDPIGRIAAWLAGGSRAASAEPHDARTSDEVLDRAFDRLLSLRATMARNLGLDGWLEVARADGEPSAAEVDALRATLERRLVPLVREIRARQARDLGFPLVPLGRLYEFPSWAIERQAPPPRLVAWIAKTIGALHPALEAHLERMVERKLLDLEPSPGKETGWAWSIPAGLEDTRIQASLTGNPTDVLTLLHELGHAFQARESQVHEPFALRPPPRELTEVPSIAFELLGLPILARSLRPRELAALRRQAVARIVLRIAQAASIDGFEREVHASPGLAAGERADAFARWWRRFCPGEDWTGHEAWLARMWHDDRLVFEAPLYWIAYAVGGIAALELSAAARRDRGEAIDRYLALCRAGSSRGSRGMLAAGGLSNPFDDEAVERAVALARAELGMAS
jgi:oligoendopeptidase F